MQRPTPNYFPFNPENPEDCSHHKSDELVTVWNPCKNTFEQKCIKCGTVVGKQSAVIQYEHQLCDHSNPNMINMEGRCKICGSSVKNVLANMFTESFVPKNTEKKFCMQCGIDQDNHGGIDHVFTCYQYQSPFDPTTRNVPGFDPFDPTTKNFDG